MPRDLLDGQLAVDNTQVTLRAIIVDQGLCLFMVHFQALAHRLGFIVRTAFEGGITAAVANPFHFGKAEEIVIALAACRARKATCDTLYQMIVANVDHYYGVDVFSTALQKLVEFFRLMHGSWKPIQNKARQIIGEVVDGFENHANNNVVRNELAVVPIRLGDFPNFAACYDPMPEHVPRGKLFEMEMVFKIFRLRTLPCTRQT